MTLKWHRFLLYIGLWVTCVLVVISGILMVTGFHYGSGHEEPVSNYATTLPAMYGTGYFDLQITQNPVSVSGTGSDIDYSMLKKPMYCSELSTSP